MKILNFLIIYCFKVCIIKVTNSLTKKSIFKKELDASKRYGPADVIPDYFFNTEEEVKDFIAANTSPTKKRPPKQKSRKKKVLDITEDVLVKALKEYRRENQYKQVIKAVAQVLNNAIFKLPQPQTEETERSSDEKVKISTLGSEGQNLYYTLSKVIDEFFKLPEKDNIKNDIITPSTSFPYKPFDPLKRRSRRSLKPVDFLYSGYYKEGTVSDITDTIVICSKYVHVLDYGPNVKPRYVFDEQCVTSDKTQTAMSGEAVCYQKTLYVTCFQTADNWASYKEKEIEFNVACECECLEGGACHIMTKESTQKTK